MDELDDFVILEWPSNDNDEIDKNPDIDKNNTPDIDEKTSSNDIEEHPEEKNNTTKIRIVGNVPRWLEIVFDTPELYCNFQSLEKDDDEDIFSVRFAELDSDRFQDLIKPYCCVHVLDGETIWLDDYENDDMIVRAVNLMYEAGQEKIKFLKNMFHDRELERQLNGVKNRIVTECETIASRIETFICSFKKRNT